MRIGCPKERKVEEYRVGLTPAGVKALTQDGHEVRVETGAGDGCGFADALYTQAGAQLVASAAEAYDADLVIKVKEPIAAEYELLREEGMLFAFLHLAAVPELAQALQRRRVTAVAFETITSPDGTLPLLAPMSMVAGRLAVQAGATALQRNHGGKGVLLPGLPGVPPAHVVIIGGGMAGRSALQMAVGAGARVTLLDINPAALRHLDAQYAGRVETATASAENLERLVPHADLLIGAVLIPGARAPHLVSRAVIAKMEPGSVAVDVSVDQGGCFETTRPTTHRDPTYVEAGVVHYAVTNMPSIVARTSTLGLADVTLPILRRLARDPAQALADKHIGDGVNVRGGKIVHPAVAAALQTG
jgi:alanine dehydrogenase